jgi:FKBP-type peptidyl-prolyl cis-trans isomerase
MTRKNTNIAVLLSIIVIVVFITLGFFGLDGFNFNSSTMTPNEAILKEIQETGTVADLRINDTVEGSGDPVVPGDTVTVHYVGVLTDGTVFDSSRDRGEPFSFTVGTGSVIQGWEQGLVGMKKGSRRILVIPPQLGYGATGIGQIPPNATLIFEVELIDRVSGQTQAE